MDAFDCRLKFKQLLETLTASNTSIEKVKNFALSESNRAHYENLYECIKERLMEVPTINRLSLLYLLDSLMKTSFKGYLDLVRKDLVWIINAIVPENDYGGYSNLSNVQKIVKSWRKYAIFGSPELESVDQLLANASAVAPTINDTDKGSVTLSKNDILKRIEEDRDRHKRAREDGWYRPDPSESENMRSSKHGRRKAIRDEFEEVWERTSAMNDSDWEVVQDDSTRYKLAMKSRRT
ncbi:hypothetical protein HDV05_006220 [Chytridiales sp. JEL 0842]|nr:hypothetical protein HDV05_006220 [Chytridiales sp. JEL 0842]